MAFTLTIETGNAAFGEDPGQVRGEVGRILTKVTELVEESYQSEGALLDINGNTVGRWQLTEL